MSTEAEIIENEITDIISAAERNHLYGDRTATERQEHQALTDVVKAILGVLSPSQRGAVLAELSR